MYSLDRLVQIPMRLFRSSAPVPEGNRSIFRYLYSEIGWYGVLSGTILSFISIFLARIGASGTQIGMINAAPAIIGLIFTLPIGQWLQQRSLMQHGFSLIDCAAYILFCAYLFAGTFTSTGSNLDDYFIDLDPFHSGNGRDYWL